MNNSQFTEHLYGDHCMCSLCLVASKTIIKLPEMMRSQRKIMNKNNCLQKFLQYCHNGCIIPITQTLVVKNTKLYYFTRNKIKLSYTRLNNVIKVLQNSKNSNNIIVYYENYDKIIYKHQLDRLQPTYKYIQSYAGQPTITIHYQSNIITNPESNLSDNLQLNQDINQKITINANKLSQYLQASRQYTTKYSGIMIMSEQFYEQQEQYHQQLYNKYGSQILCKYLIKLQIQFMKVKMGEVIVKADFEWLCFGDMEQRILNTPRNNFRAKHEIRLINVSNLEIKKYKTFQSEYQENVFNKINCLPQYLVSLSQKKNKPQPNIFEKSAKILNSNGKQIETNHILNKRLQRFKTVIQELYENEKNLSLSKIKKQRYRSTKTQFEQKEEQQLQKQLLNEINLRNEQIRGKKIKTQVSETKFRMRKLPTEKKQRSKIAPNSLTKKQITLKFIKFINLHDKSENKIDFYDYIV